ncbi:inhibitor of growth protein 3-like [Phymastichus coffea]|uniref:inhibitor of growth protein 3-like n=1 Tax=Phymastichus coffea TaxID=108790 RepID=UPI00273C4B86|nr:inhibitor of growth protein 3-like [Phymastichus coffea]
MLRLQKFIEANADLQSRLRDDLTTIRELDLVVQNSMDRQERHTYMFFQNALTLNSDTRDIVFQSLLSDFGNILKVADEKVDIAGRLQNMLSERLEQLDREIAAFEIELAAENSEVIQSIQERVLQNDYFASNRINAKLKTVKRLKSNKKKKTTSTSTLTISGTSEMTQRQTVFASEVNNNEIAVASNAQSSATADLSLYCICQRQAFGDMVACDNEFCPYEWFHYACVNVATAPKGKWYCPKCMVCKVSLDRN